MRVLIAVVSLLVLAAPAHGAQRQKPWPPAAGPGHVFAHYGEEHWNDVDGLRVLPKVVDDVIRYRPDLVTMSGDKAEDGVPDQLERWKEIMSAYDRAGVPYMAAVGNHDGEQPTPHEVTEECAGCTPIRDIGHYLDVFADRPYPMGDAEPYDRPDMGPTARPAGDPAGAATHFFVDYGNVRWVFIDNSCYSIVNCDPLQNPPDAEGRTQYEFMRDTAREAKAAGRLVFVVMHMPTRDPRDQSHSTTAQRNHVMGKGATSDNTQFELEAAALDVDAVFLGHIKGQWLYGGEGGVPYFIDGGAGGELYTTGPLGVDHGYWYGWRLIRVEGDRVTTDAVPVIVPGGISIEGPQRLDVEGGPVRYEAFARQPATESDRAVVERLELRDPDPVPRQAAAGVPGWIVWLVPLALVPLLALAASRPAAPRRSVRRAGAVAVAGVVGVAGLAGAAAAQRSEPTSTPPEALPNPARIWTSADPRVLVPVASDTDDSRRDPATQTADGRFEPRCPGRTRLSITSGHEESSQLIEVLSRPGPLLRSVKRSSRTVRRGRASTLATVRLAQPAVVQARVRRRGRNVKLVQRRACLPAGAHRIRWRPARSARTGRHRLVVKVLSERPVIKRRRTVRVR